MPEIHGSRRGTNITVWVDEGPVRFYGYGKTKAMAIEDLRRYVEADAVSSLRTEKGKQSALLILAWMKEKGLCR